MRMMLVVRRDGRLGGFMACASACGEGRGPWLRRGPGRREGLFVLGEALHAAQPVLEGVFVGKAGFEGACVPLEHSGKCVAVLDRCGNQPARPAPDEPGQFVVGVENRPLTALLVPGASEASGMFGKCPSGDVPYGYPRGQGKLGTSWTGGRARRAWRLRRADPLQHPLAGLRRRASAAHLRAQVTLLLSRRCGDVQAALRRLSSAGVSARGHLDREKATSTGPAAGAIFS
ncbi:MAG: hypothetical protein QOF84_1007 [Streptomyces sp.]|nr:hypothetical protein [Streptomyces sp.]